jgi:putative ABC transport system permease protein
VISAPLLAWLQLRREPVRLAVATAGVGFAVVLMFMQLGFMDGLFRSAVALHRQLIADLVLVHPHYDVLGKPTAFPRRRLEQVLAFDAVTGVTGVTTALARWKNPWTGRTRDLFLLGIDPAARTLALPGVERQRRLLQRPDSLLFDALSREEFGPVAAAVRAHGGLATELNGRRVRVAGLFRLGTTIGTDATVVTSRVTFRRILPDYEAERVGLGLVRLAPGADPEAMRAAIEAVLPPDVTVLTRRGFEARELAYWRTVSPIGFVFTFGVGMGVLVGAIIVYQILFADIAEHEGEYATLKAMGYTNGWLAATVLAQATVLGVFGFVPGLAVAWRLHALAHEATNLPMAIGLDRGLLVFGLTLAMCWVSALIAMRKLGTADPAEVF